MVVLGSSYQSGPAYVAQDRYFVFLVDATDSYSTISAGMHAFVGPGPCTWRAS